MKIAYDCMVKAWESELEKIFTNNEVVKPEDVAPKDLNPEDIQEFFDCFESLTKFHVDRNEYKTEEERQIHDKIMTLYYSMMNRKDDNS